MSEEWHEPVEEMSDDALRGFTKGCAELTCPYHGEFNMELLRRGADR